MIFQTRKLFDLTVDGKGSYGIAAPAVEKQDGLFTYLRITDIYDDGTLDNANLKSVDSPNASRYLLKPNDIVFARTGASTGRNYFYDGRDGELAYAGFLIKYSLDSQKVNPLFIKYYCLSPTYKGWVHMYTAGSTRGNINAQTFGNMEIQLPPRSQQDQAVKILDKIDRKIRINQLINRNLLQQISLIYNQIIEQEQETFTTLGNLCKFQEGYVNPSQGESRYFGGDVKWLRAVDINGEYIFNTSKSLTQEGYKSAGKSALMFEPDTLAISKSGTIGRVGILADYMCGNRAVINITPLKQNHLPLIYAYLSSRQEELKNLAVGSVQRNLYISILSPLKIGLPNKEKVFHFCETAQRFLKMVKTVSEENQHLADLRDALLPKLMSGELDVSELDI